jgi:predicted phosphodiesterase
VRVAIISDIHGNLTALEAVWRDIARMAPDRILQGGDIIGSGGRPGEIIDLIRAEGWPSVRGNTDEMLSDDSELERLEARMPQLSGTWAAVRSDIDIAVASLSPDQLGWLQALPLSTSLDQLTLVHASPTTCWNAPPANAADADFVATYGMKPPIHAYGHLHTPFVRQIGDKIIANSGSVGLPFDADPRASYLLVDGSRVTIRRVEYDVEKELTTRKGHPRLDWIAASLRTGRYSST